MPWPLKKNPSPEVRSYSQYKGAPRPQPGPQGGGYYVNQGPTVQPWQQDQFGGRGSGGNGGGGGGMAYGSAVPVQGGEQPKPQPPADPQQKIRDVVKQMRKMINDQKSRLSQLRRDARKALNDGNRDSYDLYVDNMVHVRMFMRKIDKAIVNVNLIGTNMIMNQCNGQICKTLGDFLKVQGQEVKVDMEELTSNYFDEQVNLSSGLEAFIENMKDLNDPDGVAEEERARERAKIEAEFGRTALSNAPDRVQPMSEAQSVREQLMTKN